MYIVVAMGNITTKNQKSLKVRRMMKKCFEGQHHGEVELRHAINNICGCGKGKRPKRKWYGHMVKESEAVSIM